MSRIPIFIVPLLGAGGVCHLLHSSQRFGLVVRRELQLKRLALLLDKGRQKEVTTPISIIIYTLPLSSSPLYWCWQSRFSYRLLTWQPPSDTTVSPVLERTNQSVYHRLQVQQFTLLQVSLGTDSINYMFLRNVVCRSDRMHAECMQKGKLFG